ncbi:MAG: hypothetical protein GF317_03155 [Candidatus Lokiarchaeota archaeon]|jgi:hypothetical protein|nr:hypothetical protein [Candidatus Lokiarchaeota archaeon]MBD3198906.1 hypothetical protein [Candidatus Lokiarchaeota archaeon]
MQSTKKFYKASFKGKVRKYLRIERFSSEEVIEEILEKIPEDDDGIIELFEVDFFSNEKKLIKRFLVVSELFFEDEMI